ncbi:MAG: transcriptional regulator, LacI family [Lachnospiraceae bacterium]|jgi:LacI family transcriptional regulator|nr:transcriptional regulator, LacI family [Anaerocolumna sp.]MDF2609246.1 transcriptional regulator, LacI family [Lachnospiraceae bacterium]
MANNTIKDVAKEANVSIATVSRVLNKNYYVSPDLEKKVMDAIAKLNYFPNSVARSLKNEITHTIGLIVSDISNTFFTMLARSIEDIIKVHDYNLIVCSTDNQKDKEYSYLQLLLEKKVDGIILNITGFNNDFITSISPDIPLALCGRKINNSAFIGDFVDSDNTVGAYELTKHLISMGHSKIAIVNGQQSVSSGSERFDGFRKAMNTIDIEVTDNYPYIYNGNFNNTESGYLAADYLVHLENPPTAILAMNNELTIGVLRYCKEHEIRIPDDISIGCYGDIFNVDLFYVVPSNITMNPYTIGTRIAELIMERIEQKNQLPNREIRFTPNIIQGNGVKRID